MPAPPAAVWSRRIPSQAYCRSWAWSTLSRACLPGVGTDTRVTVDTASWPDAPQTVVAPGHVIEVVRADPAAEAHAVTVDCGTVGRWELLVIPPDEPAGAATWLLTAAADPDNPLSARRMLALAEDGLDGDATWESEGGHGLR